MIGRLIIRLLNILRPKKEPPFTFDGDPDTGWANDVWIANGRITSREDA